MNRLLPAKFKFGLYVVEQNKFKNNQNTNNQQTICYADTYEIQSDGSIIFYQTETNADKRFKVPVLCYPSGKWDACVLIDDNNQLPVFSGKSSFKEDLTTKQNIPTENYSSKQNIGNENFTNKAGDFSLKNDEKNIENNLPSANVINALDDVFPEDDNSSKASFSNSNYHTSNNSNNSNTNSFNNSNTNSFNNSNNSSNSSNNWNKNSTALPSNGNMPGIANINTAEYKKERNEYLEKQIKEYAKINPQFVVDAFKNTIQKDPKAKALKISETDIEWVAANLIRDKLVLQRKFSNPTIQKTLSLILPDIMRRHWGGKVTPILEVLQEREETKNATAIDLAVWMVQNNFE